MKSVRRLPRDDVTVRILLLAKTGVPKETIQEAVALPSHQFQREMAALVDRGLLHLDVKRNVWITTSKGHAFLQDT